MGWDAEFRSPIEIIGTGTILRTLQDARNALLPANADDPDIKLSAPLKSVRRGLNLAAHRDRPKDLSVATIATLRALRMAGHAVIMNTDYIGRAPEKVERQTKPLPADKSKPGRLGDPSKVPDVHETLRKALAKAKALK